jgi:hypothetical protein
MMVTAGRASAVDARLNRRLEVADELNEKMSMKIKTIFTVNV